MKVCNAKIKLDEQPKYIVKGINSGDSETFVNDIPLSQINQNTINFVLDKINNSYGKCYAY